MDVPEPNSVGGYLAWVAGALASAYGGWSILRKNQSASAVTEASNEANITAIETYKELVATERAARIVAEQRADKFAEERNEAWKQLYETRGRLDAVTDQVTALNDQITLLRGEVAQLRAGQQPLKVA